MTATDRAMCTEAEDRAERYARLLWDCHCAASDGVPVPFERWLMDDGPEQMPTDVRELREAYDTVSEQQHEGEGENERLREALLKMAECHIHGCDLVYPEGSWPAGVCEICESDDVIGNLRRQRDAYHEAGENLADAVRGLDSYAALGGAPMERTERADAALEAWALASRDSQQTETES